METKICIKCGLEKDINEFRKYTYDSGIIHYCSKCKKCNYNEQKLRIMKQKPEYYKIKEENKQLKLKKLKKCNKCKKIKKLDDFRKYNNSYRGTCKSCTSKDNFIKNQIKLKKTNPLFIEKKELYIVGLRRCKTCQQIKELNKFTKAKKWYTCVCKQCSNEKSKEYGKQNKKIISQKKKEYYIEHWEERKKYRDEHKKQILEAQKKYAKNPINYFRIKARGMIRRSFTRKGFAKNGHTQNIIGCDFEFFYKYLLQTYKNNYGYEWDEIEKVHIDHIIPLSIVNTEEKIIKLCHYTNLQLLKEKDNLCKHDKLNYKIN